MQVDDCICWETENDRLSWAIRVLGLRFDTDGILGVTVEAVEIVIHGGGILDIDWRSGHDYRLFNVCTNLLYYCE